MRFAQGCDFPGNGQGHQLSDDPARSANIVDSFSKTAQARRGTDFAPSTEALAAPEYVKEIELTTHEAAPRGADSHATSRAESRETGPFGDTTLHSLDEVPDEVSAGWWQAHKHNFVFKGNRVFLKSRE